MNGSRALLLAGAVVLASLAGRSLADDEAAPVSTGGEGVTQFYGIAEGGPAPAWAAEAQKNPDYTPAAAATETSPEQEAPPASASATQPADEPAPQSTGGEGVTQYYGTGESSGAPAWSAEAQMNPDYKPSAAAATTGDGVAPAQGEQAIEACRDALNAEANSAGLSFKSSSWSIAPANYSTLDRIAKIATDCGDVLIEVGGHADSTGKPASNMTISKLRADAVVTYLTKAGVDASKLKAVGYGQEHPVASNDTSEGRRKNRRIEFLVTGR